MQTPKQQRGGSEEPPAPLFLGRRGAAARRLGTARALQPPEPLPAGFASTAAGARIRGVCAGNFPIFRDFSMRRGTGGEDGARAKALGGFSSISPEKQTAKQWRKQAERASPLPLEITLFLKEI